jgi:hypothetical protein
MFGNLLNIASSIIPQQVFTYYKFNKAEVNDIGNVVDTYDDGVILEGSVQAISQDMYEKLGLDFSKKYISIHTSADIRNVDNNQKSPDKVVWNGKEYLITKVTNWFQQDGWNRVIAVEQTEEDEPQPDEEEEEEQ